MKRVTLETAKLLKEAGFPQDNNEGFHYVEFDNTYTPSIYETMRFTELMPWKEVLDLAEKSYIKNIITYFAPTAEEILDQLPNGTRLQKNASDYSCHNHYPKWSFVGRTHGENAAEAVAQMWLRLKKEGLL